MQWEGRLRTTIPTIPSKLIDQWQELAKVREKEEKIKTKQAVHYNQRHAAKELSSLLPSDRVYVPHRRENAVVVSKTPEPRSYLIETDSNTAVRRNRRQLTPNPKDIALPPRDLLQAPTVNPTGQTQGEVDKAKRISTEAELSNSCYFYPLRTKSYPSEKIRFYLG